MARLSPDQIAAAAFQAGFRGQALTEIVAIALAESGGNSRARNPRGELSIGLTQINIDPNTSWGRARAQRYGGEAGLMDPVNNLRAAWEISNQGRNFRPWSVHRSSPSPHAGMSDRHLNAARSAAQRVQGGDIPPIPTGGGDGSAFAAQAQRQHEALLRQREEQERRRLEQEQIRQIEARDQQAADAHQQRMLQVMGHMTRQQQNRSQPIPVRSAVNVNRQNFSTDDLSGRFQRLQQQDLNPSVVRRGVDQDQMLMGMRRQLHQAGR